MKAKAAKEADWKVKEKEKVPPVPRFSQLMSGKKNSKNKSSPGDE